jgi:16S rRNA (adenine1518-N6/adenine1519-N6)-dimethyltransferase
MSPLDDLPPLREVVESLGLVAKKELGQNFLFDLNLTGKIARSAGSLNDVTVIEVGPGPGGLTRALLAHGAKRVIAIERDARCLPALVRIAERYPNRLEVINADAMTYDVTPHLDGSPVRIIANLPYNIGTALLIQWISVSVWPSWWQSATLMFQREVAERIVATPLQRADYGRLGVLCGWRCESHILFDVPASAFTPPPKITSSVVHIVPHAAPEPCELSQLEKVTHAAFGQRRKMLRQSLKILHPNVLEWLAQANIEGTRRAEELSVSDFIRLTNALKTRQP